MASLKRISGFQQNGKMDLWWDTRWRKRIVTYYYYYYNVLLLKITGKVLFI